MTRTWWPKFYRVVSYCKAAWLHAEHTIPSFMPPAPPTISRWGHCVVGLYVHQSVRAWSCTECLLARRLIQTACKNFIKFITSVQLESAINWLNFEVNRSKVKVTTRPDMVKSQFINTISYKSFVGMFTHLQLQCSLRQRCSNRVLR